MGKKEKDKSKKYNEIRAIIREELEDILRTLSVNVQLDLTAQPAVDISESQEVKEVAETQVEQTETAHVESKEPTQDKAQ